MIELETSALIVTKPSRIREGLMAILRAASCMGMIETADDGPSALDLIAKNPPNLIVLGSDLSNTEIQTVLDRIRSEMPEIRSLVLANTLQQQEFARARGADSILPMGFQTERFFNIINLLLATEQAG